MSKKGKGRKASNKSHSTIQQHRRKGKVLTPPLAQIGNVQLRSWRDERLPEVLWAALLTNLERERYLDLFRAVASGAKKFEKDFRGLEHSNLAKLTQEEFGALLEPILKNDHALAALRPLRLIESLPDSDQWRPYLPEADPERDFALLAEGIARNTFHQSEAATDCRWVRLYSMIAAGRIKYAPQLSERVREISEYPNRGDLRSVRPSIRAGESGFPGIGPSFDDTPNPWPEEFWKLCWERTECTVPPRKAHTDADNRAILKEVVKAYTEAGQHFYDTTENTGLDPRRDSVFGLVLYGLNLCLTLNASPAHRRAEGRLVIRSLAEAAITLSFLLKRDTTSLWSKYRKYGSAQAKLAFLKLADLESSEVPNYINIEELEVLANEDVWQEYQEIDLGHWADLDLRKMSEEAQVKTIYDKYYSWPSGFTHAHWAAVRDTTFDQCLNPLHRLHRVPSAPRIDMGSVATDSIRLANILLSLLNRAYPSFKGRITVDGQDAAPNDQALEDGEGETNNPTTAGG